MYFAPRRGQAFSTALALYSVDIHELSVVVVVGIVTKMPPHTTNRQTNPNSQF